MTTINPQGAVKPLSLFVSGVTSLEIVQIDLVNTDGTPLLADYIEVFSVSSSNPTVEKQVLFTVSVSAAGYIGNLQGTSELQSTSALGGWMGNGREPVKISIPGININRITISNRNLDGAIAAYVINYGIKFLEHSMKNRQRDDIGS